jgi:hypothetical protein
MIIPTKPIRAPTITTTSAIAIYMHGDPLPRPAIHVAEKETKDEGEKKMMTVS